MEIKHFMQSFIIMEGIFDEFFYLLLLLNNDNRNPVEQYPVTSSRVSLGHLMRDTTIK